MAYTCDVGYPIFNKQLVIRWRALDSMINNVTCRQACNPKPSCQLSH